MTLWHEYEGGKDEHIIILKKTDQKLKSGEEVENKLVINFCRNETEEINDYLEKTIKTGVKKLFEITPNLV